jgi:thymidine phosphorylase
LITASIMSKKLAEGVDALVLDVKTGDGAFLKKQEEAEALADLLVETGVRTGKKVVALITGMDEPLGRMIGNALEVAECLEILHDRGPADLRELCIDLSAWMLALGGRVKSVNEGRALAAEMIASGRARDTFREVIRLQGGNPAVIDDPGILPRARHFTEITAERSGFLAKIQTERLGVASMILGGGRETHEDDVDPAVGLEIHKRLGDAVKEGEALCTVHYNLDTRFAQAHPLLATCFEIGAEAPVRLPLVRKIIGATGIS